MQLVKDELVKMIKSDNPGESGIIELNLANTMFGGLDFSQHFSKKLVYQVTSVAQK
ncbi:MAG: hypothetical protein ACHP7O_02455 [Burkholderiales bacterium]